MVQSLDVISINLWQILISFANLIIVCFILRRLLFQPVRRVLTERQTALEHEYAAADHARREAEEYRRQREQAMNVAHLQAERLLQVAETDARRQGEQLLSDAAQRADIILRIAEEDAARTRKQAEEELRESLTTLSVALTEKILERNANLSQHQSMADTFLRDLQQTEIPSYDER